MTERETLAHDYVTVVSVTRRINVISGVLEGLSEEMMCQLHSELSGHFVEEKDLKAGRC